MKPGAHNDAAQQWFPSVDLSEVENKINAYLFYMHRSRHLPQKYDSHPETSVKILKYRDLVEEDRLKVPGSNEIVM